MIVVGAGRVPLGEVSLKLRQYSGNRTHREEYPNVRTWLRFRVARYRGVIRAKEYFEMLLTLPGTRACRTQLALRTIWASCT